MNVLILGASSILGQSLAMEFAYKNILILVARDSSKLHAVKRDVEKNNALKVVIIEQDLRKDIRSLLEIIGSYQIDLLINAASATSPLRDYAIDPSEILSYAMVDLITPVNIIEYLLAANRTKETNTGPLRVLFISSCLVSIKSPDRNVYSSFKLMQETILRRIEYLNKGRIKITIVKIGARFSREEKSVHHKRISRKIFKEYNRRKIINYGIGGRLLTCLYFINPFAMRFVIYVVRMLRSLRPDRISSNKEM